ncbi:MAG: pH regulation protein F [Proteobacteria bacterium]|nr:pH regulation protein F [Desulfobacteraceae bacterium]MBU2521503.1 pH regulation protein F [Pseudomonadota bacterium]MBU3980509.1 pH regulation protein F [Pseudomonadota bacterium]MBU4013583.1 pH regulation protein F [Pseudomonadota bacterium]MBU4067357.1 pH regulation protein F [Pseudomonadota bacterium]
MDTFFITTGVILGLLTLVCLYRVVAGPTVLDRIIAVGAIGNKTTAILLLMGMIFGRVEMFVDISISYALLNFIATLGAAKYFRVRKSIVPGSKYLKEKGIS